MWPFKKRSIKPIEVMQAIELFNVITEYIDVPPNCKKLIVTLEYGKGIKYETTCMNKNRTDEIIETYYAGELIE